MFEIVKVLGNGSFGEVYEAKRKSDNRTVSVLSPCKSQKISKDYYLSLLWTWCSTRTNCADIQVVNIGIVDVISLLFFKRKIVKFILNNINNHDEVLEMSKLYT